MQNRINELGEFSSDEQYICKVCMRQATENQAKEERWYYSVQKKDDLDTQNLQYFDFNDVEYVCHEHYKTLDKEEALNYVEIGYPYYSSLQLNNNNINTY